MNRYKLQLLGDNKQEWPLQEYAYVGHDAHCTIFLDDQQIERKHALIEVKGDGVYAKSLHRQLSLKINESTALEARLQDGDILSFGSFELMFHDCHAIKKVFNRTSKNDDWNRQLQMLGSVAQTELPVLLLGPSGTGKDVLAHSLHEHSRHPDAAFMSVNCSALTETLVESELFGHVKGSFTGAIADRKGAFESARGGTLFLDEIGDLPYTLQAKLLRAIENGEIRPVGSDKIIKTNVRLIAATHQNLYQKMQEGAFRTDLFYRLSVMTVEVPALKERMEDFESLLYDFARKMRVRFSHDAIVRLKKHDWPGNIRELKNVVSRATALFPKQNITPEHIEILLGRQDKIGSSAIGKTLNSENTPQMSVIKEIERQMIIKILTANKGNQKRTAIDLGMPKSTLHDRIRNYNIKLDELPAH